VSDRGAGPRRPGPGGRIVPALALGLAGVYACGGSDDRADARRRTVDGVVLADARDLSCEVQLLSSCNMLTQTGCDAGEKCSWVRTSTEPGAARGTLGCHSAGSGLEGATCQWGASSPWTGRDDCARGLLCLADPEVEQAAGVCARLCDLADSEAAASCGVGQTCVVARDGWPSCVGDPMPAAGVCVPECNPLTDLRRDGLGPCTVDPAAPAACYGVPSRASTASDVTCLPAGPASHQHGWRLSRGVSGANACAPGFVPISFAESDEVVCVATCQPVDTHVGSPGGAGGASPSACSDRGAAGAECRFWWWFEAPDTEPSWAGNELGLCVDPATHRWDRDGDGVDESAWPRCADLPVDAPERVDTAAGWGCRPALPPAP
jgi:hypothetical protein